MRKNYRGAMFTTLAFAFCFFAIMLLSLHASQIAIGVIAWAIGTACFCIALGFAFHAGKLTGKGVLIHPDDLHLGKYRICDTRSCTNIVTTVELDIGGERRWCDIYEPQKYFEGATHCECRMLPIAGCTIHRLFPIRITEEKVEDMHNVVDNLPPPVEGRA